jgi:hypothetical protein
LPDDLVYQLALITYLGWGDFDVNELARRYEALKEDFATPAMAIELLIGKASLADYLTEGVEELKKKRLDIDHLPLPVPSRKS